MNWYRKELVKTAGYNYEDDFDPQIRQLYSLVLPYAQSRDPKEVKKSNTILNRLDKALRSWNSRDPSSSGVMRPELATARKAITDAQAFLQEMGSDALRGPLGAQLQQGLSEGSSWKNFGLDKKSLANSVSLVDASQFNITSGPDKWVRITGVRLHPMVPGVAGAKNPAAEYVEQYMGNWMFYQVNGAETSIYIRGTQEAWNKFLHGSGWIFQNNGNLPKKFNPPLPSESQFDPNFVAREQERKGTKPLEFSEIVGSSGLDHKNDLKGIRLVFSKDDPSYLKDFPVIRDYILANPQVRFDPSLVRMYWNQGTIEIYDIRPETAESAYRVSKKLQDIGYSNISGLNELLKNMTGMTYGDAYATFSEELRSQPRSAKITQGAIQKNLLNGSKLSSRFAQIAAGLGIAEGQPISDEQFEGVVREAYKGNYAQGPDGKPVGPWGPQNWVGPFGPSTTPEQQRAQVRGMQFVGSRKASILADEPGSGKTMQAILGADLVREDGQKTLVISPNGLLAENWTGPDAKGPMYFCGHDRSSIAEVESAQDVYRVAQDPNIKWVILKESTVRLNRPEVTKLMQSIKDVSENRAFSAVLIDEIQKFKDLDSNSVSNLQRAICSYDIPHRIGLTGTPSDNRPDDIFMELQLLKHPVLYKDSGIRNEVSAQLPVGFAEQYLGGADLSQGVTQTPAERRLPPDEQFNIMQEKWMVKANNALTWIYNLDDEKKQNILDLFSSTFLRREKEEIKPNLREVAPLDEGYIESPIDPEIASANQQGKGWHMDLMMRTALKKAPATAAEAVSLLQDDPGTKIFIGSQFIEPAKIIADTINSQMGGNVAQAVTGAIKEKDRGDIAASFRQPQSPLRVVIYTAALGAVGLNFNNARYCIMNDLNWNPSVNEQMTQRIDRIDTDHPISILYTRMKGSYDEEMYGRIQKKRSINHGMNELMREAKHTTDPRKKAELANVFVKDAIENILIDAGLSPDRWRWFEENLEKAFAGQDIETWQDMQRLIAEARTPYRDFDAVIPLREDTLELREKALRAIELALGKDWKEGKYENSAHLAAILQEAGVLQPPQRQMAAEREGELVLAMTPVAGIRNMGSSWYKKLR